MADGEESAFLNSVMEHMSSLDVNGDGEQDEDLEGGTTTLNVRFETHDSTFVSLMEIDVRDDASENEVMREVIEEVLMDALAADICVDHSSTLDSNGDLLFPDTLKASFTF